MKNNKTLQVTILGILVVILFSIAGKIPSTYNLFGITLYLNIVILLVWMLIILFLVALMSLGFSQIHKISQNTKEKLKKIYEETYSFSFRIFAGMIILAISFNIAKLFAPIIKELDISTLEILIMFTMVIIIFWMLKKRGLHLFGEEDEK